MKMHLFWRVVSLICVALIVLYASAVFLPHDHEDCDSECVACVVIERIEKLISGLTVCALLTGLILSDRAFAIAEICGIKILKNTPVKLRVKLSN